MSTFEDVMVRAESAAAFWQAAVATGLAVAVGKMVPGIDLAEVGHIVGTPAEVDEEGDIITPATFRPGWHANLRLRLPDPGDDEKGIRGQWDAIRQRWIDEGEAGPDGVTLLGVTLITAEVATPAMVFA